MSQESSNRQSNATEAEPGTRSADVLERTADAGPLRRFFMTSDLRAATGLTRTHLDFYLREQIILPTARTESGYLLFDDTELATLRQVITWRQSGVSIRTIRSRLDRQPIDATGEVSDD